MPQTATDQTLLSRYASARDAEAFSELVRRHSALVFGVARRITGNAADAEDVAQECFFELAQKAAQVATALPGWLHRAATYRAIDHVRAATARHEKRGAVESTEPPPADDPAWKDLSPQVDRALEELPDELRLPLILHFFQGRSHAEVAERLGVPRRTISNRMQEAIERLRAELGRRGVAGELSVLPLLLTTHGIPAVPTSLTIGLNKIGLAGVGGHATAAAATGVSIGLVATLGAAVLALAFALGGSGAWRHARAAPAPAPMAPAPAPTPVVEAATPVPRHAILLVGGDDGDDSAVREHLARRGFALRVIADANATADDARGQELILISQSVIANRVRGTFTAERAPIICWECGMWDDLGLARRRAGGARRGLAAHRGAGPRARRRPDRHRARERGSGDLLGHRCRHPARQRRRLDRR